MIGRMNGSDGWMNKSMMDGWMDVLIDVYINK